MGNELIGKMLNSQRFMNNNSADLRLSPDASTQVVPTPAESGMGVIVIKEGDNPLHGKLLRGL